MILAHHVIYLARQDRRCCFYSDVCLQQSCDLLANKIDPSYLIDYAVHKTPSHCNIWYVIHLFTLIFWIIQSYRFRSMITFWIFQVTQITKGHQSNRKQNKFVKSVFLFYFNAWINHQMYPRIAISSDTFISSNLSFSSQPFAHIFC